MIDEIVAKDCSDIIKNIKLNKIKNKKILILGMSYKENVGDLRSSPSIYFSEKCIKNGFKLFWHDPFIKSILNNVEESP